MNGNDERGIVPALNSSHSTVKIDSLCIKLGIRKEKDDASKCSHFSIRGYVSGMREKVNSNLLPYSKELPPMEVPNFRYWRCEKCLQNHNETANASNETALIAVDHCLFSPSARPHPRQDVNRAAIVPFGEGTSGSKAVDETVVADLEADESQTSQEPSKLCTTEINAGEIASDELDDDEITRSTSIVNDTISQPVEPGQEIDNYQNGHPKRKARKVRLLKELLCGKAEASQQKNDGSSSSTPQNKRKTPHDHDNDNDHDEDRDPKRSKTSKADAIARPNVTEPSRNPEGRESGENVNKYEWNKNGAQRSSVHGKVGSDPMTAWRAIFSDMGRTETRVPPPPYSAPKSRGTEPYPNTSKKIPSNPIRSKFFVEDPRRITDDNRSDTRLGLDLSLNYDPQSNIRSQFSVLNRQSNQDYGRKPGFFSGETSNFPARIQSDSMKLLERSVPYGGCSGHQKLDFSDPYKRNNVGVGGYSEFARPNHNNNNHQRQENMFSIGRSDEREVIELMAKNQYERNLCEPSNGIISSFHKPMNEQMPEYLNMIRPGENVGPMRNTNPGGGYFHQDRVSNFTMNQKKPFNGVWMSDSGPQRHYDSPRYHYASNTSNALNGNGKKPQTHLYNPSNMQFGPRQHEGGNMQFGQPYTKYSDKDKGKNMMHLDLNLVAEEQNNFESLDVNRNRMCSFDSSYSNEAIPAMQLLSLMDAGKLSHQPFSLTGQTNVTKPKPKPNPSCFSHCSSIVTERTNPTFNSSAFRSGQNVNLTNMTNLTNLTASSHGQQVYRKHSVGCRPEASYVFPFPWQGEGQTLVNRALGPRSDSVRTGICVLNQNPADISSPGPENPFMINGEDLVLNG